MRNVKLLIPALALAAASSLPLAAQQPGQPAPDVPQPTTTQPSATQPQSQPGTQPETQSPAQSAPSQQRATPAPSTANAPEVTNAALRPVSGELVSKLDTKDAKNGDQVVLKTTEKATFADGVVLPKGSKITGHITDVQAHDETNPNSKVAIQFDQAEVKGGQTLPIKSVLQSIEPAGGSDTGQSSPFGTGSAPSSPPSAPGSGSATGSPGSPSGSTSAPTQGSTAGAAPASPSAAPSGYPAAGTVIARQGNIDIKTTAIPGVLIAGNSNGQPFSNASGALLGARQNIHLDGGTKVTLAVANSNTNASSNH